MDQNQAHQGGIKHMEEVQASLSAQNQLALQNQSMTSTYRPEGPLQIVPEGVGLRFTSMMQSEDDRSIDESNKNFLITQVKSDNYRRETPRQKQKNNFLVLNESHFDISQNDDNKRGHLLSHRNDLTSTSSRNPVDFAMLPTIKTAKAKKGNRGEVGLSYSSANKRQGIYEVLRTPRHDTSLNDKLVHNNRVFHLFKDQGNLYNSKHLIRYKEPEAKSPRIDCVKNLSR